MKENVKTDIYTTSENEDVKNALSMGDGVPLPMFSLLYSLMMAGRKYDEEDVNALRKIFE